MPKRKFWWLLGTTLVVATGTLSVLTVALKHEPNFYRESQVPPGPARLQAANRLVNNFLQMTANIRGRQEGWSCETTETEVNSFFEEGFLQLGEADSLRKLCISSPKIALEGDRLRLAFRYGNGWFSSVFCYEIKLWLVPKEANIVAVQILSARAGGVPISCQSVLHQFSEFATRQNFKVTLYRHEGTPVALINLVPDQPNFPATLTVLKLNDGKIQIAGKTADPVYPLPIGNPLTASAP